MKFEQPKRKKRITPGSLIKSAAQGLVLGPTLLTAAVVIEAERDFSDVAFVTEKSVMSQMKLTDTDAVIVEKFGSEISNILKMPAIARASVRRALTTPDLRWSDIVMRYGSEYHPHVFLEEIFNGAAYIRYSSLVHLAIEKADPVLLKLLHSRTKRFPNERVRAVIEKRMQGTARTFVKVAALVQQTLPELESAKITGKSERHANVNDEMLSIVAKTILEKTGPGYWEKGRPGWFKQFMFKHLEGQEIDAYMAFMRSVSAAFGGVDPVVLFKRVITVSDYLTDQKLSATKQNVLKALAESAAALERHGSYDVFKRDVVYFYGAEKALTKVGQRFLTPQGEAAIKERQRMSGGTFTFTKKMYPEKARDQKAVLADIESTVLSRRPGSTMFFMAHGLQQAWFPNALWENKVSEKDFVAIFERRGRARLAAIAAKTDKGALDFVHFGSCFSRNLIAGIIGKLSPPVRKLYAFSSESQWDVVSFGNLASTVVGTGIESSAMEMLVSSRTLREYVEKMRALNSGNNGAVMFPSAQPASVHIQVSMTLGIEGVHPLPDDAPPKA